MRQGTGWTSAVRVAAAFAALVGAAACTHPRPASPGAAYPARDRHALVLLFPVGERCKVVAGPETHIGFPGRKVVWRVVNLCGRSAELEFHIYKRVPESAPESPFVEGSEFSPRVETGF